MEGLLGICWRGYRVWLLKTAAGGACLQCLHGGLLGELLGGPRVWGWLLDELLGCLLGVHLGCASGVDAGMLARVPLLEAAGGASCVASGGGFLGRLPGT